MSLGISSRRYPMASFAAIFAIGKPVALDASADERETRGFISMTMMRPFSGSTANWMLQPPVSTPTARMMSMPMSRSFWYSRSVRVSAGATVIESPVCTPTGSTFSIEQTTTVLSAVSRISSSSYSFHPRIDSSRSTSVVGDAGCRDIRSRVQHELLEDLAVLALVDRLEARADELDVVLLEDPVVVQVDRGVQRGLAAQRRQDRVGALFRDDRLDDLPGDRLDVGGIGEVGVGHDRGRVGVD